MRNKIKALILAASLPLVMMAYESPVTEPGAENPTDMYTTTTSGPNHAPAGGPNRTIINTGDPGDADPRSSVGTPWILLGFAAAYAAYRLVRRKGVKD
ncbi:MAG: hypothetical protein MJZ84_08085 [Paludibacteraceae bacterium]|nr:hypothetical protein [Paludibacteraceae bacterium]